MTNIGGGGASFEAALSSDLGGLAVTPDNVLRVHNALKAEAVRLGNLMLAYAPMLHVGECGSDPVSGPAADQFNTKIRALVDQCTGYAKALDDAATALGRTARTYGHNEAQIAASFDAFQRSHPASPTTPAPAAGPR
ncbi:MAG TPA: hypothetical protein VNP03_14180 [Pseudonocardia sp.]|nr:hypothetical protein [Pseudonocardia sp.]